MRQRGTKVSKEKHTLLFLVLDTVKLVDTRPEIRRITTEGDLQRSQEAVHSSEEGLWSRDNRTFSVSKVA
jgi:hypothetical protein